MDWNAAAQSGGGMEAEVRQREAAWSGLAQSQVNWCTAARFGQRWHKAEVRQHKAAWGQVSEIREVDRSLEKVGR